MKNKFLFIALLAFGSLLLTGLEIQAQSAQPSPSPSSNTVTVGGYEVTSSVELGLRGLHVNGDHDKYRSDFNYRPGFRVFDSSFLIEDKDGSEGGFFDSLLITSTGFGGDPTGVVRVNVEKLGDYRLDANFRRARYYNLLENHVFGWKGANTQRNYGDVDLTIFPQNEKFRLRLGGSFYRVKGPAGFTTRPLSDEFPITRNVDVGSLDFRAGVDGRLAGFKMGFTLGNRRFEDVTDFSLLAPHPGLNLGNTAVLTGFERLHPIKGDTTYGIFTIQRNFQKRLDFTGRFIYSFTNRDFRLDETIFGRDTSNNIVGPDLLLFLGEAKRPQSRGDFGITYAVTNKFRISNTFSFDQFDITGDSLLNQQTISRTAAGVPRPTTFTNTSWYRLHDFERFTNTIEADYQYSHRFGINIGYRFTHRNVQIVGFNRPLAPATTAPTLIDEEDENSTSSFLIATRFKPYRNWSIFADLDVGESDNAFTRLSNYNYTNFRIRSNLTYKQLTFNVTGIIRNNENPSETAAITSGTTVIVPAGELLADVKTRIFSAFADWSPNQRYTFSSGFTYHHMTAKTDIIVPLGSPLPAFVRGFSEYYMRDSYGFIDVSAQPIDRVSLYASYRANIDTGQGDRFPSGPAHILSSYPFRLHMPEIRLAFRLTRNIDWNVGYQYYNYRENIQRAYPPQFPPFTTPLPGTPLRQPPNQNYNAHMPYTSLKIYFGGDRGR